ncbi:Peroxidase [Mycena sanguinolenta]|uniref:Peroxidase n=1 Tax=Mycena sanguinolenta TaxID=230812 RepID=A0A8H6YDD0_9AGAR|nr:Peroxidase [Mycena sanguinolenta]
MRLSDLGVLCHLTCTFYLVLGATVFTWPDPLLDTLDDQLYRLSTVAGLAVNCTPRDNSTISAQWLRLAYHDMATHNGTTGTGGMDASIQFEFTRAQDVGRGMLESLTDFATSPNQYVGMADIIAMGAINAPIGCGGPAIPFRGGRIDATEAGPATVPEPQQDLVSHVASFQAQGFNETEMIMLVACGHSLGGVRRVDFPLIVTEDVPTGFQTFASTVGFDNTVPRRSQFSNVTEYLDGTTQNVLVVRSNITTRSDFRIFSSDGNVTMQSLASPETFNGVCADLIERMINTVPSTVTLTDPIEPLDFKVFNTSLYPQGGSLVFLATLRIIDTGVNRTTTMFWKERTGTFYPAEGCSIPGIVIHEVSSLYAQLKGVTAFNHHFFNASIDLATSISHFWFEVNDNDGSAPFIVDNNGGNYTIDQDVVLFDPQRTVSTLTNSSEIARMVVGVKDAPITTNVTSLTTISNLTAAPFTRSVINTFELDSSFPPADDYTFYSFPFDFSDTFPLSHTIQATIDGTTYSVWVPGTGT